jgi:hypothetical protein
LLFLFLCLNILLLLTISFDTMLWQFQKGDKSHVASISLTMAASKKDSPVGTAVRLENLYLYDGDFCLGLQTRHAKMPSVATKATSYASLSSIFPLTHPIPSPLTHPDLLAPKDIHREEDLLRNPNSFRAWWTVLQQTRENYVAQQKLERSLEIPAENRALLGPLATPSARLSLQRLTYLYESALVHFAGSFKLWKSYLLMRMSFVGGRSIIKKRAGGKKKLPEMKDALEDEVEDLEEWEGPLDPIVGWEEWKNLIATFERALMYLPKVRSPFSQKR